MYYIPKVGEKDISIQKQAKGAILRYKKHRQEVLHTDKKYVLKKHNFLCPLEKKKHYIKTCLPFLLFIFALVLKNIPFFKVIGYFDSKVICNLLSGPRRFTKGN